MKKIVVPEGMLKAALAEVNGKRTVHCDRCSLNELGGVLEAALFWLSENPIVPTDEQARDMALDYNLPIDASKAKFAATEWQRRMCLAPDHAQPRPDPSREALVGALDEAAHSLETIARGAGKVEYLTESSDVRGYANSRANAARAALAYSATETLVGAFSCAEIDEICCEFSAPEYVATDDGEAWYWRFPGHELPVADDLGELLLAARMLLKRRAGTLEGTRRESQG